MIPIIEINNWTDLLIHSDPAYTGYKDVHDYNNRNELTSTSRHHWAAPDTLGPPLTPSGAFSYDYDHIGNRQTSGTDATTAVYSITNPLNQYDSVSDPQADFDYDEDGNLIDDGTFVYTWDGENRLRSIHPVDPGPTRDKGQVFRYGYMSQRVYTEYQEYQSGAWQTTRRVHYVYDGWNVVEEIDVTDTQTPVLLAQYTWGLDLSHTMQGAGGIGGLLAAVDTAGTATTEDDREYWYMYDANGNVGQLLRHDRDTSSATLAAAYEYDPYGNTLRADNIDGSGIAQSNKFRFSTKYLNDELATTNPAGAVGTTGLYYYGYRYYSPGMGRWISRDPIGERGGVHLYAFCGNNATSRSDPLGDKWAWEAAEGAASSDVKDIGEDIDLYYGYEKAHVQWDVVFGPVQRGANAVNIKIYLKSVHQWYDPWTLSIGETGYVAKIVGEYTFTVDPGTGRIMKSGKFTGYDHDHAAFASFTFGAITSAEADARFLETDIKWHLGVAGSVSSGLNAGVSYKFTKNEVNEFGFSFSISSTITTQGGKSVIGGLTATYKATCQ